MTASSPKRSPGPSRAELVVALHDPGLSRDDDVEAVADLTLEHDGLSRRERELPGQVDQALEDVGGRPVEERDLREPAPLSSSLSGIGGRPRGS